MFSRGLPLILLANGHVARADDPVLLQRKGRLVLIICVPDAFIEPRVRGIC